jgi:hypothetical protein
VVIDAPSQAQEVIDLADLVQAMHRVIPPKRCQDNEALDAPENSSSTSATEGEHWSEHAQFISYSDGSTYVGQLRDGKRNGHGIWKGRGTQYEGEFRDNHQHGHGYQTWSDGRSYDGSFKLSKFSGKGRMVWNTEKGVQTYEGEYSNDLKHGQGKFIWSDGRMYDGQWDSGKRHGKGLQVDVKGRRKFGVWSHDRFEPSPIEGPEPPSKDAIIQAALEPANAFSKEEWSVLEAASDVFSSLKKATVNASPADVNVLNGCQSQRPSLQKAAWQSKDDHRRISL